MMTELWESLLAKLSRCPKSFVAVIAGQDPEGIFIATGNMGGS